MPSGQQKAGRRRFLFGGEEWGLVGGRMADREGGPPVAGGGNVCQRVNLGRFGKEVIEAQRRRTRLDVGKIVGKLLCNQGKSGPVPKTCAQDLLNNEIERSSEKGDVH